LLKQTVLAYGGVDHLVVTAGIFVPPDKSGNVTDSQWKLTFDINVQGSYLVAEEARAVWERQGLRGSLVLTTSVNAVVSKKGSLAYDTSKAAANHLVRGLAVELAPLVRVNGLARDRGGGLNDVPARPRDLVAREIRHLLRRIRRHRFPAQ